MPAIATTEKAGWWTRLLAILIDAIGIGIIAGAGNAPLLIGAAALAVVALGAIAFFLARRRS